MSTNNRLFFSHGDKGGVGKSMLSALLVDHLLQIDREVAVIEGDKGADIAERFAGLIKVEAENLNRSGASNEAVIGFIDKLSKLSDDGVQDVVINLPGQASDTLDKFADLLASTMEMAGQELVVFYSLGTLDMHVANLIQSMQSGLMSVVPVNRQIVVMSEALGDVEKFAWTRSEARKKYLKAGGEEGFIPLLLPSFLDTRISEMPGNYSAFLGKDSPLSLTDRGLLFRWLKAAHTVVGKGVGHE